jgi:hypothetical protein
VQLVRVKLKLIKIIIMASQFTKSKASTLAKIAALPRYRSPKDLLNEPHLPYDKQTLQIQAALSFEEGEYLSEDHFKLCSVSTSLRKDYTAAQAINARQDLAAKHFDAWSGYLDGWLAVPEVRRNVRRCSCQRSRSSESTRPC